MQKQLARKFPEKRKLERKKAEAGASKKRSRIVELDLKEVQKLMLYDGAICSA